MSKQPPKKKQEPGPMQKMFAKHFTKPTSSSTKREKQKYPVLGGKGGKLEGFKLSGLSSSPENKTNVNDTFHYTKGDSTAEVRSKDGKIISVKKGIRKK